MTAASFSEQHNTFSLSDSTRSVNSLGHIANKSAINNSAINNNAIYNGETTCERPLMRRLSTAKVEDPYSALFHLDRSGRNPDVTWTAEGRRMSAGSFDHTPVMIEEVVALFAKVPDGVIVDATIGGAGHAGALLGTRPKLSLLGLDADADAVAAASVRLEHFGDRAQVVRARFDEIAEIVHRLGIAPISGVFFDLGVSSHQFDTPDRGFSYRHDAPLDMRMDQRASRTAADLINDTSMEELTQLFRSNGERFARRIARRVVDARPVTRTGQLVEIIRDAIPAPARRVGGHPAKKVFQALRIAVNEELDVLAVALDASLDILGPGGRCVVLSYHSGEDQLVKQRFAKAESGGCSCPSQLPCGCGAVSRGVALTRGARLPRVEETERNPRSQSARLRAFERRFQTGEN